MVDTARMKRIIDEDHVEDLASAVRHCRAQGRLRKVQV